MVGALPAEQSCVWELGDTGSRSCTVLCVQFKAGGFPHLLWEVKGSPQSKFKSTFQMRTCSSSMISKAVKQICHIKTSLLQAPAELFLHGSQVVASTQRDSTFLSLSLLLALCLLYR